MSVAYSIVIPTFQASGSAEALVNEINVYMTSQQLSYEIIFVDDASRDNTWEVLKQLRNKYTNIKLVRFAKNFGQHAATLCGFKFTSGEFVITIDDDLEVHPDQIGALIAEQKATGNDLIYGEYKKLNQPFFRGVLTTLYKFVAKVAEKNVNKGKGSSFRMIKGDLARKLAESHRHFIFIDELLLWYTDRISFIRVQANKNYIRKGGYTLPRLFRLTANLVMFSSTFPLKFVTNIGFMLALVNFIIGTYYLLKKFLFRIPVPGYASIIVSLLFSTGLIILCIGIVAQYISVMLKDINNKPSYHIAEELAGN